jgi:hypothetical protein
MYGLESLGINITARDLGMIFGYLDQSDDNSLTKDEYIKLFEQINQTALRINNRG